MTGQNTVDAERAVRMEVPLAKPWMGEEESRLAEEVVRSGWRATRSSAPRFSSLSRFLTPPANPALPASQR